MIRIATVGYLNAKPLTAYLDRDRYQVVEGHPSQIATQLREGKVDVALVPVAAALTDGDFRIVGEVCIGAEGPVHSVLLVGETPPEQWTEVVLDGVSRTSVTLARLLLTRGPLAQRVRPDLVIRDGGLGEGVTAAQGTVGGLVIGDAARELPERLTTRLDLAELWFAWTGKPFVFAVWAGRPDLPAQVVADLKQAGRTGLAARAQDYEGADLDYVTRSIRYTLDDRALIGLRRYAALAHKDGLVGTDAVELYGPGRRTLGRPDLDALLTRAADGERLSDDDLAALDEGARLADLCAAAQERSLGSAPRTAIAWHLARRIVVTDLDVDGALGWRRPGDADSVLLTPDDVAEQVTEASEVEAAEIQLVGGLHPGVGVDSWVRWIRAARDASDARVRALSLDGLRHLAAVDDVAIEAIVERLLDAGLAGLAEDAVLCLDDAVRHRAAPGRLTGRMWLALAETVHRAGLPFAAGLEFGAGETADQRRQHLQAIRALHQRTGGVTRFRVAPLRPERDLVPQGATAQDHVRLVALARLALDVAHHEAAWLHVAPGVAQNALHAGADTLGAVVLPVRADQDDNPYVNPRAQMGRTKVADPWEVFAAEVAYHLKRSGFGSDRQGPTPRTPRGVGGSDAPQPAV